MINIPPNQTSSQFHIHNKVQDLKLFEDKAVGSLGLMLRGMPSLECLVDLQPFESELCGTRFKRISWDQIRPCQEVRGRTLVLSRKVFAPTKLGLNC
jgi:hypothetical protein